MNADEVAVLWRAEVGPAIRDMQKFRTEFDRSSGQTERRVKQMEMEIRRSSGAIGNTLRGLAGSFAAYFGVREIARFSDQFTRLQNQLKVAGLEGAALASVQEKLFGIANRYGVEVNSLAELYGKSSQAGKELGATQQQLLTLTEASSQALLITGTSAQQASGALLGLTQALSSGVVRAEEYNQMNEGGLRPLLEAAAASDQFGGSIQKLREAIYAGTLSSKAFFEAIQQGSDTLETKANQATLTLAGSMNILSNAFTKYIGEANQASGVTDVVAVAIKGLADNLDTIIPAIVTLATALGVGMVTNAIRGSQALVGVTTVMGGATVAARGLAGALGGPVGIAITAVTVGLGYLIASNRDAADAMDEQGAAASQSAKFNENLQRILDQDPSRETAAGVRDLAAAHREAAKAAYEHAAAEIAAQYAQGAKKFGLASQGMQEVTRTERRLKPGAPTGGRGSRNNYENVTVTEIVPIKELPRQRGGITRAGGLQAEGIGEMARATSAIAGLSRIYGDAVASAPGGGGAPPSTEKKAKGSRARGAAGTPQDELDARFEAELRSFQTRELQARADRTDDIEAAAIFQEKLLEIERQESQAQIDNNKELTAAQRAQLQEVQDNLFGARSEDGSIMASIGVRQSLINDEKERAIAQRKADLARANADKQLAELDLRAENADSLADLRDIELEMVNVGYEAQKAAIEASDVLPEIRDARLAQLEVEREIAKKRALEATAGPLEEYREQVRKTGADIGGAVEQIEVDGLKSLNDGLTDAIMGTKTLGEAFSNVANQIISDLIRIAIQQAIIAPLMGALGGGGGLLSPITPSVGGGGGGIGSILGSTVGHSSVIVPGFANGGSMILGGKGGRDQNLLSLNGQPLARVGRGEMMSITPSMAIPNTNIPKPQMQPRQTIVNQTVQIDARDSIASPDFVSWAKANAREQSVTAAAGAVSIAERRAPGAVQRANRYGR